MHDVLAFIASHWGWLTVTALPFIVNLVAQASWSGDAKSWCAFGFSVAYGVLAVPITVGLPAFTSVGAFLTALVPLVPIAWAATAGCYLLFRRVSITNDLLELCLELFPRSGK